MNKYLKLAATLSAVCVLNLANAQGNATDSNATVSVNGTKIDSAMVNSLVKMAVSNGAQDTPQLRQSILNDLVLVEAVTQDVKKTGFLKKDNNDIKLKVAQQNALLDLWFANYFVANPVTEAQVRAEYDRQLAISKQPKNTQQYQVAQILVGSEAEGETIIKELNAGAKFDALAKSTSLDKNTSDKGGVVGWVLADQLVPPINEIIVNIGKGDYTKRPVQTASGWHIIKLDDVKPYVMQSFEQLQPNIANALVQQRRNQAIAELMKNMKVVPVK
jgi:peptidyl-prolyl cis-trans isomerase C